MEVTSVTLLVICPPHVPFVFVPVTFNVYFGVVAAEAVVPLPLANRLDKPTAKHSANTANNNDRKIPFLFVFTT